MVNLDDTAPGLIELLKKAGDEWGPLGVAEVAAQLTDQDTLIKRLQRERRYDPNSALEYGGDVPYDPALCRLCGSVTTWSRADVHMAWHRTVDQVLDRLRPPTDSAPAD